MVLNVMIKELVIQAQEFADVMISITGLHVQVMF